MPQTEFTQHNIPVLFCKSAAYDAEVANTIVLGSGIKTIDFRLGNRHTLSVSEAVSITLQEPNGPANCRIAFDYTGSFTPTFVTTVKWADDTVPSWTKVNGRTDWVMLEWTGSKWIGVALLNFVT